MENRKQRPAPSMDPAFKPSARLEIPDAQVRVLPSDLKRVVQRLQKALAVFETLNTTSPPVSSMSGHLQALSLIRNPKIQWFLEEYGDPENLAPMPKGIRDALPKIKISAGPSGQLLERILGNPAFQEDLQNFQRWLLSQRKVFARKIVPDAIIEYIGYARTGYQEDAVLDDLHAKCAIAVQLENGRRPFVQHLSDFPHDGIRIDWEPDKDMIQYEADQAERAYWTNREVLRDSTDPLAEPDPEMDHKVQQRKEAIQNQAIAYAVRHYGADFSKLPPREAGKHLLISYHSIAALIYNDAQLRAQMAQAVAKPRDLARRDLMMVLEAAFQQLRQSQEAFVKIASGADSEIPWKRLGPVLRSFARIVSLGESAVTRFSVRSVNAFLETKTTTSEKVQTIGMVIGLIAFVAGIAVLTGGTGTAAFATAAKYTGFIALFVDSIGFTIQAVEEAESEVLNRYALVNLAMEEFPEGTLGSDLIAYFAFMLVGNTAARFLGSAAKRRFAAKGAEEIREKSRAVLKHLETKKVSQVAVQSDKQIEAASERLAGLSKHRGTATRPSSGATYSTNLIAISKHGLDPMGHLPKSETPRLSEKLADVKRKLDREIVEIAEQLDIHVVDVVEEARKLGIESEILILDTTLYRVEAIDKFIKVRRELLLIEADLNRIKQSKRALNKRFHPQRKNPPKEVIDERARLNREKEMLEQDLAEARKWWEAAKLTRTTQGMGDWHELWLSSQNPHYRMAVNRDNPAFDGINEVTNGLVSAKSVRIDELAAASLRENATVGIGAGKAQIDDAIKKFRPEKLKKAKGKKWDENFPGINQPQSLEALPREIELAFLTGPPPDDIQRIISTELNSYLTQETIEQAAEFSLKIRYLSDRELMGLNSPEKIRLLRKKRWPKPILVPGTTVGVGEEEQEDAADERNSP